MLTRLRLVADDLETNTVVSCGLRLMAALGQIVTAVGPVYIFRKNLPIAQRRISIWEQMLEQLQA